MRPPAARSLRLAWLAPLAAFLAAAGVTAIVAVALLAGGEDQPEDALESASPAAASSIAILDAPSADAAQIAVLPVGTPLRIEGRSADGGWLAVTELGLDRASLAAPVAGWAHIGGISGLADSSALTVVDAGRYRRPSVAPAAETPADGVRPTLTPDLPDLLVDSVYARENRLVVVVANGGSADADGAIEVRVDGGEPHRIDVGKPLRPGDTLERALDGEYVQRRATVIVTLSAAAIREENAGNNTFSGVVSPDAPNDLEVVGVELDPDEGFVVVMVRNNSLIPLAGAVTIGVRQTVPADQLLLREERALDVAAGATQRFELTALSGVGAEFLRVIISTDAISDADSANNTFPR